MSGTGQSTTRVVNETYGGSYSGAQTPEQITGYEWGGWFTDEACTTPLAADAKVQTETAHKIYGKWTPVSVEVTFHGNGGT